MRFFPNAAPQMRCRWVQGSVRQAPIKPAMKTSPLKTRKAMCNALGGAKKKSCYQCFNRARGRQMGFLAKGPIGQACRPVATTSKGALRVRNQCLSIRNPRFRKNCMRCVNNKAWPGVYLKGAKAGSRCHHLMAPAGLKKAMPPKGIKPINKIPGMGIKKKPSNAAVNAAFARQGPGKKMGIVNPMVCVKKFKGRTGLMRACKKCVSKRPAHHFRPGMPAGKRCMRR
jgi:hypothetical protein